MIKQLALVLSTWTISFAMITIQTESINTETIFWTLAIITQIITITALCTDYRRKS